MPLNKIKHGPACEQYPRTFLGGYCSPRFTLGAERDLSVPCNTGMKDNSKADTSARHEYCIAQYGSCVIRAVLPHGLPNDLLVS